MLEATVTEAPYLMLHSYVAWQRTGTVLRTSFSKAVREGLAQRDTPRFAYADDLTIWDWGKGVSNDAARTCGAL